MFKDTEKGSVCVCLMYWGETMVWKEKERSKIMAVQMDNLGVFLETQ